MRHFAEVGLDRDRKRVSSLAARGRRAATLVRLSQRRVAAGTCRLDRSRTNFTSGNVPRLGLFDEPGCVHQVHHPGNDIRLGVLWI